MTHTVRLNTPAQRQFAHRLIEAAPVGAVVTIRKANRSTDQNALMWSHLTRISAAKPEGREWRPEVWKAAFMHALGHQVQFAMALDGSGPFPLGFRSSHLDKEQFGALIEVIHEYAARHGIKLYGDDDG